MVVAGTAVVLFFLSFGIAAALLPLIERINRARGFLDRPGGRKDHDGPIPYGGGLAILAAVAFPAMGGLALAVADRSRPFLPEALAQHVPGIVADAPQVLAILCGTVLMLVVGWIDDWRGLSPWVKLVAQVAAAVLLVVSGIKITKVSPVARLDLDGPELAEELFRAYLHQILVVGFFHADPHPGNVFLTDDDRIALLDLGMVAQISAGFQENLLRLIAILWKPFVSWWRAMARPLSSKASRCRWRKATSSRHPTGAGTTILIRAINL